MSRGVVGPRSRLLARSAAWGGVARRGPKMGLGAHFPRWRPGGQRFGPGGRAFTRRARRPSAGSAGSCQHPAGRPGRRTRGRGRRWPRRRRPFLGRPAAGPATASRRFCIRQLSENRAEQRPDHRAEVGYCLPCRKCEADLLRHFTLRDEDLQNIGPGAPAVAVRAPPPGPFAGSGWVRAAGGRGFHRPPARPGRGRSRWCRPPRRHGSGLSTPASPRPSAMWNRRAIRARQLRRRRDGGPPPHGAGLESVPDAW